MPHITYKPPYYITLIRPIIYFLSKSWSNSNPKKKCKWFCFQKTRAISMIKAFVRIFIVKLKLHGVVRET